MGNIELSEELKVIIEKLKSLPLSDEQHPRWMKFIVEQLDWLIKTLVSENK